MSIPQKFLNKKAEEIKKRDAEAIEFSGTRRSTGEACSEWASKETIIEVMKLVVTGMDKPREFTYEHPTFTHELVKQTALRVSDMADISYPDVYKKLLECAAHDVVIGTAFRAGVSMVESRWVESGWKPEFSVADHFAVTPEVEAYFQALRKKD